MHSHADLTAGVVATNKIIGESFALCFHIGFWLGPGWAFKVMKFKQARVNGGSNYDSRKVAKCLVI